MGAIALDARYFTTPPMSPESVGNFDYMMVKEYCVRDNEPFWTIAAKYRRKMDIERALFLKPKLKILNRSITPGTCKMMRKNGQFSKRPLSVIISNLGPLPVIKTDHVHLTNAMGSSNAYFRAAAQLFTLTTGTYNGRLNIVIATTRGVVNDQQASLFATEFERVMREAATDNQFTLNKKSKLE
jgi:hypothetical protein